GCLVRHVFRRLRAVATVGVGGAWSRSVVFRGGGRVDNDRGGIFRPPPDLGCGREQGGRAWLRAAIVITCHRPRWCRRDARGSRSFGSSRSSPQWWPSALRSTAS